MSKANETQVGGTHYQSKFQHWDFIAQGFGVGYFKGVVTKYLVRWRKKNGKEDLQKARHYLEKLAELIDDGTVPALLPWADAALFCASNDLEIRDAAVVSMVCDAKSREDLVWALMSIDEMIAEV